MRVTEGIRWIATYTTNFDETVAFFSNVLGLAVAEESVLVTDTPFTRYLACRGAKVAHVQP
jgi:catechol 2,3-dioxygenase-like lactoylglutathione lyase family enzyme